MVNEVNKLILNTLVEQGAVYIPNVGTLSICRTAARKRGNKIIAPSYSVTFTTESKASSLSDVIMTVASVERAVADDIVTRWHTKVSADGRVVIEGVGTISNGYFSPDSELIAKFNRHNETILLNTNRGNRKKWWLVPLIILALASLGISLYNLINRTKTEISTDTLTTNDIDVVNQENNANTSTPESIEQESVFEPLVEPETIEDEVIEATVSEPTPAPEQVVLSEEQQVTETTDWREKSVRHYVIFGSYSTAANANVATKKIVRQNPAAQCKTIRLGSLYAVAIYGSDDRNECVTFKRLHRTQYKDAWIHSPKK